MDDTIINIIVVFLTSSPTQQYMHYSTLPPSIWGIDPILSYGLTILYPKKIEIVDQLIISGKYFKDTKLQMINSSVEI